MCCKTRGGSSREGFLGEKHKNTKLVNTHPLHTAAVGGGETSSPECFSAVRVSAGAQQRENGGEEKTRCNQRVSLQKRMDGDGRMRLVSAGKWGKVEKQVEK